MPDPDIFVSRVISFTNWDLSTQHWGEDMDTYYLILKQWDKITHVCPKSNIEVKGVNDI